MKLTFTRKFLLAYMPVFLLTVTVISFMSFLIVNDISRGETAKANAISTGFIVDTVDRMMNEIELKVLQELELTNSYQDYLVPIQDGQDNERNYRVVKNMNTLQSQYGLIDSMYIYRKQGDVVLTQNGLVELEAFPDGAFLGKRLQEGDNRAWSGVRLYPSPEDPRAAKVVSLAKNLPIPFGQEGLLVVNISLYRMERAISELISGNLSYLDVYDKEGNRIFEFSGTGSLKRGEVLTTLHSAQLGWSYRSGIQAGELYAWVSLISHIWIVIGILTVLAAIMYTIYITKRSSRPITLMMKRIELLQLDGAAMKGPPHSQDDLTMISSTLENLIEQTMDYEKEQRSQSQVLRRQLFRDLFEGVNPQDLEGRLTKLKPFGEVSRLDGYSVILVELNRIGQFQTSFSIPDQNILKYAVMNVMNEIIHDHQMYGWCEWIGSDKMGCMVGFRGSPPSNAVMKSLGERCHSWIHEYLRLSITLGIGRVVRTPGDIRSSYEAALSALEQKLLLGQPVMVSEELPGYNEVHSYQYFQSMSQFVREFRLAGDGWRPRLESLFESFRQDRLRNEDIHMQLLTLLKLLERDIGELSDSLAAKFRGELWERTWASIVEAPDLEEVQRLMSDWLNGLFQAYVSVNESKSYRALIEEIKKYIESNYSNPDLSLKHISDQFEISGKYTSYLFKEEFNTRFVDFLVHLRVKRAEVMLENGSDTIQDIAISVGYANAITFGRVFKKVVGITPGDYRKLKMQEKK